MAVNMRLEEQGEIKVPSLPKFRDFIDHLECKRKEKIFIEVMYLTGSRVSELCCKVIPWETLHQSTRAYGSLLNYEFTEFRDSKGTPIKLLLLRLGVAKHKVKVETVQNTQNEAGVSQIQKVRTRYVPIPCTKQIEPWSEGILRWISEKRELKFDFTRRTALNIIKKNLKELDPKIHCHSLRHYRVNHLMMYYGFDPTEISSFVGWSLKTTYGSIGQAVSSNVDFYSHLSWKSFVGKMLTPLNEIYDR